MLSDKMYRELLCCAVEDNGLERILDLAAECLKNPVILVDTAYCLLGYTRNFPVGDPAWDDLVEHGCSSPNFVRLFSDEQITARCMASPHPCLVTTGLAERVHRAVMRIELRGRVIAFFSVFECGEKLSDPRLEDFQFLGRIVSVVLARDPRIAAAARPLGDDFLIDLLDGKLHDPEMLAQQMKTACVNVSPPLCLYALQHPDAVLMEYYSQRLKEQFPAENSFRYRNFLLLLRGGGSGAAAAEFGEALEAFCRDNHLAGGISLPFYSLMELPAALRQCYTARSLAELSGRGPALARYRDYALHHMIRQEVGADGVRSYFYPGTAELLDWDRQNGGNLAEMLRYYLFHDRSVSAAADAFFLHRNTVLKRLQKISSITGWKLEDPRVCFHVRNTMVLLTVYQLLPEDPELPFR